MPDLLSGVAEAPKIELPPQEESSVHADEKTLEQIEQTQETFLEKAGPTEAQATKVIEGTPVSATPAPSPVAKDEELIRVEKILEEGLGPYFVSLPSSEKPKFRQKGEQASKEISQMVRSLQVQGKRVLRLIRDWLLTIPKVNKFFLEQEAKIKTDKIVELVEALKEERMQRP